MSIEPEDKNQRLRSQPGPSIGGWQASAIGSQAAAIKTKNQHKVCDRLEEPGKRGSTVQQKLRHGPNSSQSGDNSRHRPSADIKTSRE